jgi:hypothetical protein
VREALQFSAMFRQPESVSKAEKFDFCRGRGRHARYEGICRSSCWGARVRTQRRATETPNLRSRACCQTFSTSVPRRASKRAGLAVLVGHHPIPPQAGGQRLSFFVNDSSTELAAIPVVRSTALSSPRWEKWENSILRRIGKESKTLTHYFESNGSALTLRK